MNKNQLFVDGDPVTCGQRILFIHHPPLWRRILRKLLRRPDQRGIYTLTVPGKENQPWVLTREKNQQ